MTHPIISTPKQGDFLAVPGSPLAYWLTSGFKGIFASKNLWVQMKNHQL
jgi:hypothetical protein